MEIAGTWLVMIGSGFAVLQAVWVIGATGRKRSRLLREKARSDAREETLAGVIEELRKGWGDTAADSNNFEDSWDYKPDSRLDKLRAQRATLESQRDRWVRTFEDFGLEGSTKMRELQQVEGEWRQLWSQGVLGLLGGVLAFIGGVLIAWACQMVCVSRTERNGKNHDHDGREEAGRAIGPGLGRAAEGLWAA